MGLVIWKRMNLRRLLERKGEKKLNHPCAYAVKAKDIPEVQQEYTDIWELVKQFYQVQNDEIYWKEVFEEIEKYRQKHPTPNAAGLVIQFVNELDRRRKEKYQYDITYETEEVVRILRQRLGKEVK